MPEDIYGRDSSLPDLTASQPTVGPLYREPDLHEPLAARGRRVGRLRRRPTSVRGGYGLYFNTNNQQNLIVTVTNPPATPRPVIVNPTFPTPDFDRAGAISIRPVQCDLDNPRLHVWNVNVQRELLVAHGADRRLRRLARPAPAAQRRREHGPAASCKPTARCSSPPARRARTRASRPSSSRAATASPGTTRSSSTSGAGWRDGVSVQSSYTLSTSEDTTQASTFFSDATNGTTSALPEFIAGYNKGPSDFDTPAQLGAELQLGAAVRARTHRPGRARARSPAGRCPASGRCGAASR